MASMIYTQGANINCKERMVLETGVQSVTSAMYSVSYQNTFTVPPGVFAFVMRVNGNDPVLIRAVTIATTYTEFIIQEDKCRLSDAIHIRPERVSYLVVGSVAIAGMQRCSVVFSDNFPTSAPTVAPGTMPTEFIYVNDSKMPTRPPLEAYNDQPRSGPTGQPSDQPTGQPTSRPSGQPSDQPSDQPTGQPSWQPTDQPTCIPTGQPTGQSSGQPTGQPTRQPTGQPTCQPTCQPTYQPTRQPSSQPTGQPTSRPSGQPSDQPSDQPTGQPSWQPTDQPTFIPTGQPTGQSSGQPTGQPTRQPTGKHTGNPTSQPTDRSTGQWTDVVSSLPTEAPTDLPTINNQVPVLALIEAIFVTSVSNNSVEVVVSSDTNNVERAYCVPFVGELAQFSDLPNVESLLVLGTSGRMEFKTAFVRMEGLQALTLYTIICFTVDSISGKINNNMTQVFDIKKIVTTGCCTSASAFAPMPVVPYGFGDVTVLQLRLANAPKDNMALHVRVRFDAFSAAGAVEGKLLDAGSLLHPAFANVTKSAAKLLYSFILIDSTQPGYYSLSVFLTGASSIDYTVIYENEPLFIVANTTSTSTFPPVLQSAQFSNDGLTIKVSFDQFTDRGQLPREFLCDRIFSFHDAKTSSCAWLDDNIVVLRLSSAATVVIGDKIRLLSNIIKAKCSDLTCINSTYAQPIEVVINPPDIPMIPKVSVSAPQSMGPCDVFTLDLSASSGSGGRPWTSISFSVISDNQTINRAIEQVLNSPSFSLSAPTSIPGSVFGANPRQYSIRISLCNFFKRCGDATYTFSVTNTQAPVVRILGPSAVDIKSFQSLQLSAISFMSGCDGSEIHSDLVYRWTVHVVQEGAVLPGQVQPLPTSDPRVFKLAPNALKAGQKYSVRLQVNNTMLKTSTMASVKVTASYGDLVARITGGQSRSIAVNTTAVIDASNTYDEDGSGFQLQYQWSCATIRPAYSKTCELATNSTSNNRLVLVAFRPDVTMRFSVTVTDPPTGRYAEAYTDAMIVNEFAADVVLDVDQTYFNVDRKVLFTSRIVTRSGGTARWFPSDSSVSLSKQALTPIDITVSDEEVIARGNRINFGFSLAGNTLFPGLKYTFYMTFTPFRGKEAKSSVALTTNGGPTPGIFSTSPREGHMLDTIFSYYASYWSDVDLPLTYAFSYAPDGFDFIPIQLRSSISFGSAQLPSGLERLRFIYMIKTEVFDALLASSVGLGNVTVRPQVDQTIHELWGKIDISRDDVAGLKQSLGIGTSILNSLNCSKASNCTGLNRKPCNLIENTCGPCISHEYTGEAHANSVCVPVQNYANNQSSQSVEMKLCPNDCSSNGECMYHSYWNGIRHNVSSCNILDNFCTATCLCAEGYSGVACSYNSSLLESKRAYRLELLQQASKLVSKEEFDSQSLISTSALVSKVASVSDEVTAAGKELLVQISKGILSTAADLRLPSDSVENLGPVLSLISTQESTVNQENFTVAGKEDTSQLFELFGRIISDSMAIGEPSAGIIEPAFRMSSVQVDTTVPYSITTPVTSAELVVEGANPSATIMIRRLGSHITDASESNFDMSGQEDVSVGVSVVQYKRTNYINESFVGDPIQLFYSSDPCLQLPRKEDCIATVVSPYYISDSVRLLSDGAIDATDRFNITCRKSIQSVHTYKCAATYQDIVMECNGTWEGTVNFACPVEVVEPRCGYATQLDSIGLMPCTTELYTRNNITCRCPMTVASAVTIAPKISAVSAPLSEEESASRTRSPQFVPLLRETLTQFESTWVSFGDINTSTLARSFVVVATMGTLLLFGSVLFYYGGRLDAASVQHKSSPNSKVAIESKRIQPGDQIHTVSYWTKLIDDLMRHHRWLNVIFSYSATRSRQSRTILLIGYVFFNMFANALFFNVTQSVNAEPCSLYLTQAECVAPQSELTGSDACAWSVEDNSCDKSAVSVGLTTTIYIAIISAVFTVPFVALQEYLVAAFITAPDLISNTNTEQEMLNYAYRNKYRLEFARLLHEVNLCRTRLTSSSRIEFDEMWAGACPERPLASILTDLNNANALTIRSCSQIKALPLDADTYLLNLFQCDLMPYAAALAIDAKQRREMDERPQPVARWKRHMSWLYVIVSNAVVFVYIFLFSIQQEREMQWNWVRSLLLWLFVDIFVFTTATAYITSIYIPSLFAAEATIAKDKVQEMLVSTQNADQQLPFNACKYLFASYKVAEAFPDLAASRVILRYSSPWPRRSYHSSISIKSAIATLVLLVFRGLVELPPSIQDDIWKTLLQVASANALLAIDRFGFSNEVSIGAFLLVVIAVMFLTRVLFRAFAAAQNARITRAVSLNPEPTDAPAYYGIEASYIAQKNLPTRRASLQEGVEAVKAVEDSILRNAKAVSQGAFVDSFSKRVSDLDSNEQRESKFDAYNDAISDKYSNTTEAGCNTLRDTLKDDLFGQILESVYDETGADFSDANSYSSSSSSDTSTCQE